VVENLTRRASREPALDWRPSIGLAAQGREAGGAPAAGGKGLDSQH
jgi:hypothetical protein